MHLFWRFSDQVVDHRVAVSTVSGATSYAELCRLSTQLSGELAGCTVVALLLPRGLAAIVSFYAAFKAGAACCPLSVSSPLRRLALCLQDTRAEVVALPGRI